MAYICLDGLFSAGVNIVGVMGGKKSHPTYEYFKKFVLDKGLNFIEYDDLKSLEFIERIKALNADVAVVCSFNYKIPKVLLEAVKGGFINVHPSLLPHYKGKNPYSSVIYNNESHTGVTLHLMDEGFDTGEIIFQQKLEIGARETMGTLFNRLNFLGFEMLLKLLREYETKPFKSYKQPQIQEKVGYDFADENSLIDFSKSAEQIERFVRALNPFLVASAFARGTLTKIYAAEVINPNFVSKEPFGTIVKVEKDRFLISTSKGLLAPKILQFGSFFVATAEDFIRSLNLKVGERFISPREGQEQK